jgi:oxepin-CoA hydrolase/3-oxo-5,6-dehydrosuberyl-CoA semialdehyde dehydrogenase
VRLTCKQKVDRDVASAEHPSGIVKWFVEVFDAKDELVAVATILTMVQKKQEVFVEMTEAKIQESLNKLTENSNSKWGTMSAQKMVEHLEFGYRIASSKIQDFEISTPEKIRDKVHNTLYDYKKMPQNFDFPLAEKSKINEVKHADLVTAKEKMLEARSEYIAFFKQNPEALLKNAVFGEMNRYEWQLLERKHLNHHFEQFGIL